MQRRDPDTRVYADFKPSGEAGSRVGMPDEDDHVLVLDFEDNSRGSKPSGTGFVIFQKNFEIYLNGTVLQSFRASCRLVTPGH